MSRSRIALIVSMPSELRIDMFEDNHVDVAAALAISYLQCCLATFGMDHGMTELSHLCIDETSPDWIVVDYNNLICI